MVRCDVYHPKSHKKKEGRTYDCRIKTVGQARRVSRQLTTRPGALAAPRRYDARCRGRVVIGEIVMINNDIVPLIKLRASP